MEAVEWNFPVDFLVDVQRARDRFVVGRMQAKWPSVLDQVTDHGLQFTLHDRRHIRTRLQEVFEVCGRECEHFSRAIDAVEVIAVPGFCDRGPILEIRQFMFRVLRKQVVGQADGKLAVAMELADDSVIVWIILKSSTSINGARDTETVQFPGEQTRGVELIFTRKLWSPSQR